MKAIPGVNPSKSLGEMPKVRWKQKRNSIYLRFRTEKDFKMNVTVLDRSWSNANLPDLAVREDGWEAESLIVPCEVLLVWNHSTSRQGWFYCSKVGRHSINSIILVCRLVHFDTFFQEVLMVTVLEHLTAKARQLIGRVKFDLKQSQSVAYSKLLILLYIKKKQNVILRL